MMRIRTTLAALCVGICCFLFFYKVSLGSENEVALALDPGTSSASGQESEESGETTTLSAAAEVFVKRERPWAQFDHDEHMAAMESEGCESCHPSDSEGELVYSFPAAENETNAEALMNSYHDKCIACHQQRAAEHKTSGPVSCGQCHRAQLSAEGDQAGSSLYDLARGPLLWVATVVFVVGIAYRIIELFLLTKKKETVDWPTRGIRVDSPAERKLKSTLSFRHSLIGKHPVMAIASGIFHTSLFAAPLFAAGHTLLLRQSWGISLWRLPSSLTDALTVVFLLGVLFMFVRRIAFAKMRAVSSFHDFLFLFVTAAPFLTGFLAYHQWFEYRTIIILHMLVGELMLIVIPFTKLSHMVFFFFVRGLIGSEHTVTRGGRVWAS